MAETTKKSMEPMLKESYGKPKAQDNAMESRVCPGCGRRRLGAYCRECGQKTMKRKGGAIR